MRITWRGLELPTRLERDTVVSSDRYGRFFIEPFERGFGTTIGNSIRRIFVYQGAFVGVCGTVFGSLIGYVLCYIQDKYRLLSLPSDIYFVSAVPVDLQIRDFVAITAVALFLCWLSSFYPAKKASELDPVDAIRSE